MIEARGASLVYLDHGREAFACSDVSLDVRDGEFVGVLGPSGSGKSSLLYLLSGLKTATSGEVRCDGRDYARLSDEERSRLRRREFGFVFQFPFMLGYLTVWENALVGDRGTPEEAHALLDALGIAHLVHRFPHELSGGERQRACVARALVGRPRAIFADEPTASLDHATGASVVELMNGLRGSGALVMVTHDPTMLEAADRVLTLADGTVAALA